MNRSYVSGLKEDLDFQGAQYNVVVTCLTVGCESQVASRRRSS